MAIPADTPMQYGSRIFSDKRASITPELNTGRNVPPSNTSPVTITSLIINIFFSIALFRQRCKKKGAVKNRTSLFKLLLFSHRHTVNRAVYISGDQILALRGKHLRYGYNLEALVVEVL